MSEASYGFIFTNGLSIAAEKEALQKFLRRRAVSSIGMVYIDVPYGQSHAQMVQAVASELGISIAFTRSVGYEGFRDLIRQSALGLKQRPR